MKQFDYYTSTVSDQFIDWLYKTFNDMKDMKEFSKINITENCQLTENIIYLVPKEFRKEITKDLFEDKDLFWMHLLKFSDNGKLDWHSHKDTETYSYVIYMDDNGGTMFNDNTFVSSKKNRIVYFNSNYEHKAITNNKIRYVAAGGLIKK